MDRSKRQEEEGSGESKRDVGADEEKKDSDGGATKGLREGVSGGVGKGPSTTPSQPRTLAQVHKEKAKVAQTVGTGGRSCSREQRIHEKIQEKMRKFCESVEALKRGETGESPVK